MRELRPDDWPAVRAIYEEGIRGADATFETEPPSWERFDAAHPRLRLVAERDGSVAGWAALSPVSPRHCYRGVGEVSVYVAGEARGAGLGRALLDALVGLSEQAGYWTLTAGVFPENEASLRLHRACGFREVGVRERLGESGGIWRDVVLLERRSAVVGHALGSRRSSHPTEEVSMASIASSVEIARSPEDVFAYVTDVSRHPEWQGGLVSAAVEPEGPVHVGSRTVHRRKVGLMTVTATSEITAYEPPRLVSFRGIDGPVRADGTQRVEPAGEGSRVSFEMEMHGHGLGTLMLPLARRSAARQVADSHEKLKRILEGAGG